MQPEGKFPEVVVRGVLATRSLWLALHFTLAQLAKMGTANELAFAVGQAMN